MSTPNPNGRVERDTMGEVIVPGDALYGAQTQRAVENFPISSLRFQRSFIEALGLIKASAAVANRQLGELPSAMADAIEQAAVEVSQGCHDEQFVVDVFQSGSATSTNMNANEVIAHLANTKQTTEPIHPNNHLANPTRQGGEPPEKIHPNDHLANPTRQGGEPPEKIHPNDHLSNPTRQGGEPPEKIHPNDHVNKSQSSNDVIPTAIHVAAALHIQKLLTHAMTSLHEGLLAKATEFHDVIKIGRTHLQDAVPMRLGHEFSGYATQVEYSLSRITRTMDGIYELALGGTAVGTGLNTPVGFAKIAIGELCRRTSLPFREAANHFEAQASKDAVSFLSGALKSYAIALTKISNDIRWLGSGPRGGLGELKLPALQPGSSIMPGKVNPVIAESVLMVCAQVIGHDAAISWCCASGNLELNTMMPLMAYNLIDSIDLLAAASTNLLERCIRGLDADRVRCAAYAAQSFANATALVPEIGYEKVAAIVGEAYRTGRTVFQVAAERSHLPESRLRQLLDPASQAGM